MMTLRRLSERVQEYERALAPGGETVALGEYVDWVQRTFGVSDWQDPPEDIRVGPRDAAYWRGVYHALRILPCAEWDTLHRVGEEAAHRGVADALRQFRAELCCAFCGRQADCYPLGTGNHPICDRCAGDNGRYAVAVYAECCTRAGALAWCGTLREVAIEHGDESWGDLIVYCGTADELRELADHRDRSGRIYDGREAESIRRALDMLVV